MSTGDCIKVRKYIKPGLEDLTTIMHKTTALCWTSFREESGDFVEFLSCCGTEGSHSRNILNREEVTEKEEWSYYTR